MCRARLGAAGNPSVTQRYAHLSAETLLDAANCTSDVIQGAMPEPA
jgi:hypothetical protein